MMDPNESVVNLDEEVGDTPIISHNSSQHNLLLVSGVDQNSGFAPSGTESGLSSPPALATMNLDLQRKSGDALIQDVIEQLETQCSLRIDDTPTEPELSLVYHDAPKSFLSDPVEPVFSSLPPANAMLFAEPKSSDFKTAEYYPDEVKMEGDERRSSVWIPSSKTKEALAKLPHPDKRLCYTMPGVMVEESMGDPVRDLIRKHVGELEAVKRSSKTSNIPENLDGLRILIADGNFRSAIDMTGKLLKNLGQGFGAAHKHSRNSEEGLKLWSIRLQLLVLIGQHNLAASESEPFGNLDSPDLYYEYYPEIYRGRKGSLIPYEMRLLHAEIPRLISQPAESLTRINRVAEMVKIMLANLNLGLVEDGSMKFPSDEECSLSIKLWNNRLIKTYKVLARCLLAVKEYRLVLEICEKIVSACDNDKPKIFDAMGRLSLQLGDSSGAAAYFQRFNASASNDLKTKASTSMHTGFCLIFNNSYTDALQAFQKALEFDPSDVSAANNAAVCMLYLGRLQDAVDMLENLITNFPKVALQESVCTNLCTLYELASARSVQKKVALLNLVNEHHGDGFNPSCLKLTA